MTLGRESLEGFLEEVLDGLQNAGEEWKRPGTSVENLCSLCPCDRASLSKPCLAQGAEVQLGAGWPMGAAVWEWGTAELEPP